MGEAIVQAMKVKHVVIFAMLESSFSSFSGRPHVEKRTQNEQVIQYLVFNAQNM